MEGSTIGEVAKKTGLNPKTIRYYEEIGLLQPPKRGPNGYRLFGSVERRQLDFIIKARKFGLSLGEIKDLLNLAGDSTCLTVRARTASLVREKIKEVDQKISELIAFRDTLRDAADRMEVDGGSPATLRDCLCLKDGVPNGD